MERDLQVAEVAVAELAAGLPQSKRFIDLSIAMSAVGHDATVMEAFWVHFAHSMKALRILTKGTPEETVVLVGQMLVAQQLGRLEARRGEAWRQVG